jgi:phosphoglycerate dehydrogenase-like enzyme
LDEDNSSRTPRHTPPVIGLYHADPEPVLDRIRTRVPGAVIRVCDRWDGFETIAGSIDVLVAFKFGRRPFPREEILSSPRLRWVQLASAGADHIAPYSRTDLVVTNASGIHGTAMAQYVIGTLVDRSWNFPRLRRQQAARVWQRYPFESLTGQTMVVVGAGQIGTVVGRAASSLGMRVVGVRRTGTPAEGFDRMFDSTGLHTALSLADVVVLCTPLTNETRDLIGRAELALMKRTAVLVNVSRGGVVDEGALAEALAEQRLGGAILDVFQQEPLPATSPFWTLDNVFVTPHISSDPIGWEREVAELFCDNLERWNRSDRLRNIVDPGLGY